MVKSPLFVDINYSQQMKNRQYICGDSFMFQKIDNENRYISVLSDGLGSGVKANILASMTAKMALKLVASNKEVLKTVETIMSALPICRIRKISYATFSILDTSADGHTRVIEMGNPQFFIVRNQKVFTCNSEEIFSKNWQDRKINVYDFYIQADDRLIFFSDGIIQAGLGTLRYKLGWRLEGCRKFIEQWIVKNKDITSSSLCDIIIKEAISKEKGLVAHDDMTCAVVQFRHPKTMILMTGPPFNNSKDKVYAGMIKNFGGEKIICGGTTARIISREFNRKITVDLSTSSAELPPISYIDGIDLVTEGIFTLTKTAQLLEYNSRPNGNNAATKLIDIIRRNDIIEFVVGTRINDAHQDPNLPGDLEIRRNIIKRIAKTLKGKYLKEVKITYI